MARRLTLAFALVALAAGARALPSARPETLPPDSPAAIRAQDIAFFARRVAADPGGAIDLVKLGALYLERFRDTGDEADGLDAEAAARRSLANRGENNPGAWQLLTAALLGEHRFVAARAAAEQLVALDPEAAGSRAILGETLLELGEYPAADRVFSALAPQRHAPAVAARYARWLELRGRAGEARALLEAARDDLVRSGRGESGQLAWFELRLGELALRFGALAEARRRLDRGLALQPGSWRLLSARARLALATGDYPVAIALGDSSLVRRMDPATLALVGDAWLARGDSAQAAQYFRAMEAAAQAPPGGFHRAWYLALLDHDLRVPEILAAVRRDLTTRRDVYGYDLAAWAWYKSGQLAEARDAMRHALAWGTEDPLLHAHARRLGLER